jgi:hypothetical protein
VTRLVLEAMFSLSLSLLGPLGKILRKIYNSISISFYFHITRGKCMGQFCLRGGGEGATLYKYLAPLMMLAIEENSIQPTNIVV